MAEYSDRHNLISRRTFLRLIGGATTPLILAACGAPTTQNPTAAATEPSSVPQATSDSVPQRGGTLRIGFANPVAGFNVLHVQNFDDFSAIQNVYEPLVWVDPQWKLQPRLATSWEPSEGGKVWTFNLREGVTFHHGTPFTAADVIHTFQRLKDPSLGIRFGPVVSIIDTVEAVTALTARFKLTKPCAILPMIIALEFCVIVAHDQNEDDYAKNPMGTGPFRLKENLLGDRTVLVRNKNYWDSTLPYLDEVQFVGISDPNTQVASLASGTVEALASILPIHIPTLQAAGHSTINEIKSGTAGVMVMRMDQKPFDDPRVRQAFKLVVDREGMIKAVLQGHGGVGNDQNLSPSNPYWANVPPPAHDVEKAKALLTEAGYPNGLAVTFYASEAAVQTSVALGVAFKEMAAPAGITVTVQQVSSDDFWANHYMQKPFFATFWFETTHPDCDLNLGFRSDAPYNETGWKSEKLDHLIDTARVEFDLTKQKALYADIQKLISEEGGMIVPYFRNLIAATRDTVTGVEFSPRTYVLFREASIKKV